MRTPTLEVELGEQTRRVGLKSHGQMSGDVDGAWWPGSRDLAGEVPALLALLIGRLGRVERVTYNLSVWDPAPRRLTVDGRVVRLEGFVSQPAEVVTVVGGGGRQRLTLLVVPPDTDPATAERVVTRASTPGNAEDVRALLALDGVTDDGPSTSKGGGSARQRWEGEGGSVGAPTQRHHIPHLRIWEQE